MGVSASAGAKAFSHTFSLAVTLATMTNLTQYTVWKCAATRLRGSLWSRFGPALLLAIATPLILADLTRHCLQDADIWPAPGSSMYQDDCEPVEGLHGLFCLTTVGFFFSIVFTYAGFIIMAIGILWGANVHKSLHQLASEAAALLRAAH